MYSRNSHVCLANHRTTKKRTSFLRCVNKILSFEKLQTILDHFELKFLKLINNSKAKDKGNHAP